MKEIVKMIRYWVKEIHLERKYKQVFVIWLIKNAIPN